jgi:hypothetical protein
MKILFDQGVPVPLRESLISLEVSTCFEMGWAALSNGQLIAEAESQFHALVTTDKNLRYQQDLSDRKIAIFVLPTTRWPQLKPHAQKNLRSDLIHN